MRSIYFKSGIINSYAGNASIRMENSSPLYLDSSCIGFFTPKFMDSTGQYLLNQATNKAIGDLQMGTSSGVDTSDPTLLTYEGEKYIYVPGALNNDLKATSLDANLSGAIRIISRMNLTDWSPASSNNTICSKWQNSPNRSYQFFVQPSGNLQFQASATGDTATSLLSIASSSPIPATDGTFAWVRVDYFPDISGNYEMIFYYSFDGNVNENSVQWTQLGVTRTGVSIGNTALTSARFVLGANDAGGNLTTGKISKVFVYDLTNNTLNARFDASLCGQTGYTDPITNTVWTVGRSLNGKKTTLVTRHTLLFGTNSSLQMPNNALMDIPQGQGYTAVILTRAYNNVATSGQGKFIEKFVTSYVTAPGWSLYTGGNTLSTGKTYVSDGTIATETPNNPQTEGSLSLVSFVRNEKQDRIERNVNSVVVSTNDVTTGQLNNSSSLLYVGRAGLSAIQYLDMEMYGMALFRRSLTSSELLKIIGDFA